MSGKEELIFLEQFAVRVTDFSSQYGPAVGGISYTANNIIGPPSHFPAYGDFPETYVPKTYGPWWKLSPTAPSPFSCEDNELLGQDFIDVQYETPVYPFCVSVYETHQAGCVRRVWAGDGQGNWFLLNQKPRQKPTRHSQIFSSTPQHVNFLTKILRIEIDSSLADYYPELDAVLLVGTKSFPSITETLKLSVKGLSDKILEMKLHEKITDFCVIDNIRLLCSQSFSRSEREVNMCHLSQLPDEILRCILSYLDIRSLCSVASVSTQLNHASRDPLLYTSVNLKPYWYCVNRSALEWLETRCKFLQRLDLSWCGSYGKLGASDFSWFIKKIGSHLRLLRLENCTFLNNESIYWISTMCSSLQGIACFIFCFYNILISELEKKKHIELSLRGCRQMESTAFWHLGRLKKIKRLALDHTQIELATFLVNLQSMEQITHLSIAFCHRLAPGGSLDEIIRWLNQHRPNIESLDMWRTGHFSQSGMEMLVGLTRLRGLDLGWCGLPTGYWVSQLANNCRLLQKLFLTATRVVSDADLIALSQCCPLLIQLDILGNAYISPLGCSRVLENCHFLELLDVSYCRQIEESHVLNWIKQYPQVSIQRIS